MLKAFSVRDKPHQLDYREITIEKPQSLYSWQQDGYPALCFHSLSTSQRTLSGKGKIKWGASNRRRAVLLAEKKSGTVEEKG